MSGGSTVVVYEY